MKLSCHVRSNWERSMMKTRQDNDMTDCISLVYAETKTKLSGPIRLGEVCDNKLSWLIGSDVVYNQNQIGQRCDWWYKCELQWKWNSIVVIDQIRYGLWWKLDRTTTRPMYMLGLHWNQNWTIEIYLTGCGLWWKPDRITTWLIIQVLSTPKMIMNSHDQWDLVQFVTKIREDNNVTDRIGAVYAQNDTALLWPIKSGVDSYKNKMCQHCDWWYRCWCLPPTDILLVP